MMSDRIEAKATSVLTRPMLETRAEEIAREKPSGESSAEAIEPGKSRRNKGVNYGRAALRRCHGGAQDAQAKLRGDIY
jgi:hypothetical protein